MNQNPANDQNLLNYYRITGPFYHGKGKGLTYHSNRVIEGRVMGYAVISKRLTSALRATKALRTVDSRTHPERKDWPILFRAG